MTSRRDGSSSSEKVDLVAAHFAKPLTYMDSGWGAEETLRSCGMRGACSDFGAAASVRKSIARTVWEQTLDSIRQHLPAVAAGITRGARDSASSPAEHELAHV